MAKAQQINPSGANAELAWPAALLKFDTNMKSNPAAGVAAVVTMDADADTKNIIRQIHCGYDAAPTGGFIQVEDVSGTVVFKIPIGSAAPVTIDFDPPLCAALKNTAMIVTLSAGGGSVVGGLYVNGYREL